MERIKMPFLVRKLAKRDRLYDLCEEKVVEEFNADIPTTEFRTTNGCLSTWMIDSLDSLDDAILAIAVTSSEISKMDVIVIDTSLLLKSSLNYKQTYAGQDIPIPDLQNRHCDIVDISIKKLVDCTSLYQEIVKMDAKTDDENEKFIVRYALGEIKDLLKKAIKDNRVDANKARGKIKVEIEKLKPN